MDKGRGAAFDDDARRTEHRCIVGDAPYFVGRRYIELQYSERTPEGEPHAVLIK